MEVATENRIGYKKTKLGWIPEGWDTCTFADIADKKVKWSITGGPFGSDLKAEHYIEDGVRIIQLQNIGDGHFNNKYKIFTSEEKANQLLGCNIYPGDLILSKMGDPVTRTCLIPDFHNRYVMGSDGIRLVPDEDCFDKIFVLLYLNYSIFRKIAIAHSTGSTRQRIGLVDLKKLPFILPPLPEQQKIATILSTWDKAINNLETLISEKETLKKGLMQVLLTGKKRFPGFTEEWREVKLGEIGKVKMCKRVFSNETTAEGDIPFYKIGTFGKEPDAFISNDLYSEYRLKFSYPNKGDILISASGTLGRRVVYDGVPAYFQDSNIVWLGHDESKVLNPFLYYIYETIRFDSEGGTIQRLYNSIIYAAKFKLPTIDEQQKIASVLSAADKEIETLKKELNSSKEQKRGLMQKLLTGEVRVKVK